MVTSTLFDAEIRRRVLERLERLTPESRPRWGTMSVGEMICHLIDYFEIALGERRAKPYAGPVIQILLRGILLYWPFGYPKGAKTLPELQETAPKAFEDDRRRLGALIEAFAKRLGEEKWPPNPVIGKVSGGQWGRLSYKHTDHHLKQFGV